MSETQTDLRRKAGQETRERMLAAAEELFAERGFDGASTRALAEAASADVAMIVYHFGSKLGLYREMMVRRATALNTRRLDELRKVMASANGAPALSALVRALVATNIRMRSDATLGGLAVARLIARELLDPREQARLTVGDMFAAVAAEFVAAFKLSLPNASSEAVHWAYHFSISTMVQTMANVGLLEKNSNGECDMSDVEHVIDRLVPFIVGGILQCVEFNDSAAPARRGQAPATVTTKSRPTGGITRRRTAKAEV